MNQHVEIVECARQSIAVMAVTRRNKSRETNPAATGQRTMSKLVLPPPSPSPSPHAILLLLWR